MKCNYCGRRISESYKFCPECGANLFTKMVKAKADSIYDKVENSGKTEQVDLHNCNNLANTSGYAPKKVSSYSIAGFVLSICAVIAYRFSFICAILALVLSCVGVYKCKNNTGKCYGLAVAGMVISIIVLSVIVILFMFYTILNLYLKV